MAHLELRSGGFGQTTLIATTLCSRTRQRYNEDDDLIHGQWPNNVSTVRYSWHVQSV